MNWFYNLRINYKFLLCFGLLTIAINICGYSGISGLKLMSEHSRIAYETMLVPVSDLGQIATHFQNSRVDLRDLIQQESQTEIQTILERMGKRKEDMAKRVSVFRSTILTDSVRNLFGQFEESERVFSSEVSRITDLVMKGDKAGAQAELFSPAYVTASANEQALLEKLVKMKLSVAD
ncbi:MAG: MCP four helix bundle domain-containing protein, partial [Syntrophothermus sp.]